MKKTDNNELSNEIILHTMELYLQEYIHRDKHMWSQNYKFFISSLIVMLLPNLTERLGISLPDKLETHSYIFPIFGMILSFVFLYVSLALTKRFKAISETYNDLIKLLPLKLQRKSIHNMPLKFLNYSHSYVMTVLMFFALIFIGILALI